MGSPAGVRQGRVVVQGRVGVGHLGSPAGVRQGRVVVQGRVGVGHLGSPAGVHQGRAFVLVLLAVGTLVEEVPLPLVAVQGAGEALPAAAAPRAAARGPAV